MGLIRGGLVFSLGVLLLLSFLAMNTFLTLYLSLEYGNVKSHVLSFTGGGVQGELSIYDMYYKQYECGFFDCFKFEEPLVVVSKHAQNYWETRFYFSLIVSLTLFSAMFLFSYNKENIFIYLGGLLGIASLPFLKIGEVFSWVFGSFFKFSGSSGQVVLGISDILFSKSKIVFGIMFVLAIMLIAIGISIKVFNFETFLARVVPGGKKDENQKFVETKQKTIRSSLKTEKIIVLEKEIDKTRKKLAEIEKDKRVKKKRVG